jgi:hypothetical protein
MKKIITACFLILLMGCSKDDEIKNEVVEKPIPEGSKKADIIVDAPYDLKETDAHSLYDFISMDSETTSLFIPEGFESAAFFISEDSAEVLAVVRTSPSNPIIKVNATTVSQALMTLVPSYHSLSKELRNKFDSEAASVPPYKDLVVMVDKILKEGKTVFSSEPEFINQIVELHVYINQTYLGISDEESPGRGPEGSKTQKQSEGV